GPGALPGPRPRPGRRAPPRRLPPRGAGDLGGRVEPDRARRTGRGRLRPGPRAAHRPRPRPRLPHHRAGLQVLGRPARRPRRTGGSGHRLPLLVRRRPRPPPRPAQPGDRPRRPDVVRPPGRLLGLPRRLRPGPAGPAPAPRPLRRPRHPARPRRRRTDLWDRTRDRPRTPDGPGGSPPPPGPRPPRRRPPRRRGHRPPVGTTPPRRGRRPGGGLARRPPW